MRKHDIVFATGPAGTGKTYLAMAMAVHYLMQKSVRRIILTRPALEAGESLGFLPGDMRDKLGPYLRPLYDALYDMMEADTIETNLETGVIEIVPLAYMRGRTLNNAFVILDEAQNCTSEQLRMFLTRLGFDSKTVVTGDITQTDLPGGKPTGLIEALRLLEHIEGIRFIALGKDDVVRHPLIQQIIQAYENYYSKKTD
jgi:phosphate starvation-inducible PhoH-like protein